MERFQAPWDPALKVSTGFFLLLMIGISGGLVAFDVRLSPDPHAVRWALLVGPLVLAGVIPVAWALSPRGYTIEGGELTVNRALFPVRIPLADIRGAWLVGRAQAGALVRVAGSGGLFGHFGRYYSRGLGAFRLYATRRDRLVVVDTEAGRFVLTPATPERFLEALHRAAPRAGAVPGTPPQAPRAGAWKLALVAVAGVGALLSAILLVAAGWAPLAAGVGPDAIVIERRWAGPVVLPLVGLREAALLPPEQARGWRRVNGVGGLGNASYGAFSSTALGPFTLYAWRRGPYVRLETDQGPVILTPDDPEAFVAEVRARLAP
jgi:hypothetical protein